MQSGAPVPALSFPRISPSNRGPLHAGEGRSFAAGQLRQQSKLVLIGGLVLTLLGTAYLYGGWRRTREIAVAKAALQEEFAVRKRRTCSFNGPCRKPAGTLPMPRDCWE